MNALQTRNTLRILHLIIGGAVGTYIYSPWSSDPVFALTIKAALMPLLGITGLVMWQQARLRRMLSPAPRSGEGKGQT